MLPNDTPRGGTAIYTLTPQGAALGVRIAESLGADLFLPVTLATPPQCAPRVFFFERLGEQVAHAFPRYAQHVFISAAGIAVRCIAPLLHSKISDPAVVVLDQKGRYVVSLVSGHLGGANDLALRVAAITGGQPVITTATDTEGLPSMDSLAADKGLAIRNPAAVKTVSAALLAGKRVPLYDPNDRLGLRDPRWADSFERLCAVPEDPSRLAIIVSVRDVAPAETRLVLHPRVVHAGIGCRRGASPEAILDALHAVLAEAGIAAHSLAAVASVSIKCDELGLLEAAARLAVPLRFYTPEELAPIPVRSPSPKAKEVLGIDGVAESAAFLSAHENAACLPEMLPENPAARVAGSATVIIPKTVRGGVTVSLSAVLPPALPGETTTLE